ncbi:hypothetical protein CROQUDRAFT_669623 [Cronartium quercuum f. sp. fusiforme G11]|uniref:Uncharacterized protein n=1 Tax=Cronartium quercuum f. sp. fusiforme G11 TaxID=708437 RepID=A0A9P6NRE9_9BASI|nr:hypothetical protein CROQUDRAFT_669623 [Cronartium quercuum f. sp. fusiforme G11]
MPDRTPSFATSLSARLLPNAYVRFKSSDQLHQILMLQSSSLPLQWPTPQASGSTSWLDRYRALRTLVRPLSELVTFHTDAWMNAFDAGVVTPLSSLLEDSEPTRPRDESEALANKSHPVAAVNVDQDDDDDDDGGGWTIVTRGGQHGRSSTIPTQHSETRIGADPYAQSSMAGRDAGAGVKVMKRGFAQAFSKEELEIQNDRKRKGGELNRSFYRTNIADSKKARAHTRVMMIMFLIVCLNVRCMDDLIRCWSSKQNPKGSS